MVRKGASHASLCVIGHIIRAGQDERSERHQCSAEQLVVRPKLVKLSFAIREVDPGCLTLRAAATRKASPPSPLGALRPWPGDSCPVHRGAPPIHRDSRTALLVYW